MTTQVAVRLGPLDPAHAGELLTVQRAAFVAEAQRNAAPDIPPLTETLDQVRAALTDPAVLAVGAWLGARLIGSVRGRVAGDRVEVSRLAVAPDQQGLGVGRALLTELAARFPAGLRTAWLVTGARSAGNIGMYQRSGYRLVGEGVDAAGVPIVRLEKDLTTT